MHLQVPSLRPQDSNQLHKMLGISMYYYLNYFSQRNHADSKSSAWGQPLCQRKALFKNLVVQRPQLSKVQDFGFLLDKHIP